MKWYVLNYNFNKKEVENFNIFESHRFFKCVEKLLKEYITFEDFKEKLDKDLMYCFWSKREFEISVGDAFEENLNKYEKIDVYRQLKPNLDILAKYIIDKHNKGELK